MYNPPHKKRKGKRKKGKKRKSFHYRLRSLPIQYKGGWHVSGRIINPVTGKVCDYGVIEWCKSRKDAIKRWCLIKKDTTKRFQYVYYGQDRQTDRYSHTRKKYDQLTWDTASSSTSNTVLFDRITNSASTTNSTAVSTSNGNYYAVAG